MICPQSQLFSLQWVEFHLALAIGVIGCIGDVAWVERTLLHVTCSGCAGVFVVPLKTPHFEGPAIKIPTVYFIYTGKEFDHKGYVSLRMWPNWYSSVFYTPPIWPY